MIFTNSKIASLTRSVLPSTTSTKSKRWALYNVRTGTYLKTLFSTRDQARSHKSNVTKIVDLKNGIFVR